LDRNRVYIALWKTTYQPIRALGNAKNQSGLQYAISELPCASVSNLASCKTFHRKISLFCYKMNLCAGHSSIWIVSHRRLVLTHR